MDTKSFDSINDLFREAFTFKRYRNLNIVAAILYCVLTAPFLLLSLSLFISFKIVEFAFRLVKSPSDYLLSLLRSEGKDVKHATQAVLYFVGFPTIFLLNVILAFMFPTLFLLYFLINCSTYCFTLGGIKFNAYLTNKIERDYSFDSTNVYKPLVTWSHFGLVALGYAFLLFGFLYEVELKTYYGYPYDVSLFQAKPLLLLISTILIAGTLAVSGRWYSPNHLISRKICVKIKKEDNNIEIENNSKIAPIIIKITDVITIALLLSCMIASFIGIIKTSNISEDVQLHYLITSGLLQSHQVKDCFLLETGPAFASLIIVPICLILFVLNRKFNKKVTKISFYVLEILCVSISALALVFFGRFMAFMDSNASPEVWNSVYIDFTIIIIAFIISLISAIGSLISAFVGDRKE